MWKRQLSRGWQVFRSTMPSLHLFTLISGFPCQEETSSPPNHWRLRTSKKEWGYRDWNYHYMMNVSFFFLFWKTRTLEKLMLIFCNPGRLIMYVMRWLVDNIGVLKSFETLHATFVNLFKYSYGHALCIHWVIHSLKQYWASNFTYTILNFSLRVSREYI